MTSSALPSDRPTWHNTRTGQATPKHSPIGRRETIRDSLEHGDWQQAAQHLHEAHTCQEWLGCGLSSWSAYVQTIPLSRMYDWQLRFVHRSGVAGVSYSFRAAFREAQHQRPLP
jgi:hypothetical protein